MTQNQITEAIERKATEQSEIFDCMVVTNLLLEDGLKVDHHDVAMVLDSLRATKKLTVVSRDDATKYEVTK